MTTPGDELRNRVNEAMVRRMEMEKIRKTNGLTKSVARDIECYLFKGFLSSIFSFLHVNKKNNK